MLRWCPAGLSQDSRIRGVLEVFTHTVIPMEPLSATESEAALAVRLEDCNRTFSDEVIRPIVDVSGGHPAPSYETGELLL